MRLKLVFNREMHTVLHSEVQRNRFPEWRCRDFHHWSCVCGMIDGMLTNGYGVLVGELIHHERDRPDNEGRWFHVKLRLAAPATYECAVDVDSKKSDVGVRWRVLTVDPAAFAPASALAPGYHALASTSTSGALDLLRHPAFAPPPGCLFVVAPPAWLRDLLARLRRDPWAVGSHLEASTALESILAVGRRTLVWGEPFTQGLGMHNVHQNQGDPVGSQWWAENGIWQDGGVMTERPDGRLDAFISRFSSQADRTDQNGHPL